MSAICAEQHRVGCALGGYYTALAINGILPVLHCGPGCQEQVQNVLALINGGQNAHPFQEMFVPCTSFSESDVIFGGTERLRKTISIALESYKAEMLLIVSGCTPAIVGDDVAEVAESFSDAKIPIRCAELPGFKGNNLFGHSEVLRAILGVCAQREGAAAPRTVNVFGVVPFYDPFWDGTLENFEALLRLIGLEPNTIYGRRGGFKNVKKIPSAEFNIVVSPWIDLDAASELEERFGTPSFHYPAIPVGPTETSRFLRELAAYADLDSSRVGQYISDMEDRYYYYVNRSLSWVHECRNASKEFIVISGASSALSFSRFLINDLGLIPRKIYIAEGVPGGLHETVRSYFSDVAYDGPVDVVFTNDGGLPAAEIQGMDLSGRPVILGSSWDDALAQNLGLPYIPVSVPLGDYPIGGKNYFGYDGGLSLFCEYCAACDKV
jgi:nitrogenase molybdenum-iron protein beta chain